LLRCHLRNQVAHTEGFMRYLFTFYPLLLLDQTTQKRKART
jgi:hypothetical protein